MKNYNQLIKNFIYCYDIKNIKLDSILSKYKNSEFTKKDFLEFYSELKNEVNLLMEDKIKFFETVEYFINTKMKVTKDIKTNSLQLRKFSLWFSYLGIKPNIEFLMKLIGRNVKLNALVACMSKDELNFDNVELKKELLEAYFKIYKAECLGSKSISIETANGTYISYPALEILSKEQMNELFVKVAVGDLKAREKLILHNIRLVIKVVLGNERFKDNKEDSIQNGIIGLDYAISKYDYSSGYSFSTYAVHWIKNKILAGNENDGLVRYPKYMHNRLYKYQKLLRDNNFPMSDDDMALKLKLEVGEVRNLKLYSQSVFSLETPANLDSLDEIKYFIEDEEKNIEEEILNNLRFKLVQDTLKSLTSRERTILELYYRFLGNAEISYTEIGKILKISGERVRQIHNASIKKIVNSKEFNDLLPFAIDQDKTLEYVSKYKTKKKPKSIYEYFKGYSKEEVVNAFLQLTPYEISMIDMKTKDPKISLENKDRFNSNFKSLKLKIKRIMDKNRKANIENSEFDNSLKLLALKKEVNH